ncbi:hypothetical protein I4U23_028967 [Adineta vaga]|nr:hypothetical protein I4U23_028967 [Adineta vaga]
MRAAQVTPASPRYYVPFPQSTPVTKSNAPPGPLLAPPHPQRHPNPGVTYRLPPFSIHLNLTLLHPRTMVPESSIPLISGENLQDTYVFRVGYRGKVPGILLKEPVIVSDYRLWQVLVGSR